MKINPNEFIRSKINVDVTPGEMLRTLRELQGLTQRELSELTGISQSNISAMEHNTSQIGRERALLLSEALKVHPAVIMFPDFDMTHVA